MMIDYAEPDSMNASIPARRALKPARGIPNRNCGIIGTQQMKDYSVEHLVAGQQHNRHD